MKKLKHFKDSPAFCKTWASCLQLSSKDAFPNTKSCLMNFLIRIMQSNASPPPAPTCDCPPYPPGGGSWPPSLFQARSSQQKLLFQLQMETWHPWKGSKQSAGVGRCLTFLWIKQTHTEHPVKEEGFVLKVIKAGTASLFIDSFIYVPKSSFCVQLLLPAKRRLGKSRKQTDLLWHNGNNQYDFSFLNGR